jgi:hypothetical protein
VAITAPVPRPPHRFWRRESRWMTISRHPGSCADPLPTCAVRPTRDSSLRSTRPPTVSPADFRSELDPRSLDPDRSFWSAFAELIRGQTSPTDFCNCITTCEQPNPNSSILAGTETSISFLFFDVPRPLPCGSGGTRRAALRPPVPAPVLVPLGCPSLPNRDADSNASPPKLAPWSIVRIDVHGSKDRAKDASPGACDDVSCLRRVHAHRSRMLTAFPSSASSGHPLSSARQLPWEDTHERRRTDLGPRSDDAPRRAPPSRRPGCLSPPRHAKDDSSTRRDCSLRPSRRLSRSRRPHSPLCATGVFEGHCKVTVRSPALP